MDSRAGFAGRDSLECLNKIPEAQPPAKKYIKGKHKGMTAICIRDNGIGIQKDIQEKLFDVGENHSTPGTDNEKGTGLGLPICYDFIKRHGGNIWVESEPGNGAIFCFTLKSIE